jgi:4-amino-4-deoxy-L-arabinose transferase-like glycosyltransferase
MILNKQLPFWLFTISVYIAIVISSLVQEGMFFDGIIYSSISRNLAEGLGSILNWKLIYTQTFGNPFVDHPPLAIIIQSFFFKIFGDHLFVERIYSFLAAIITALLIVKIWRLLFDDNKSLKELSWFPVFLWVITPVVFWAYSNNMLENTMAIFDLTAVYLIYKSWTSNRFHYLKIFLSGIMILFAFLCKGPVGLFPIATPLLGFLILKKISFKNAIIQTFIIIFSSSLILSIIFILNQETFHSFLNYINEQVIRSIKEEREITVESRFFILKRLSTELIPAIIICTLLFVYSKFNKIKVESYNKFNKLSVYFIAIGLSGSVPIIVSMKQSGFYMIPSIPFIIMSFGIFSTPYLNHFISKITFKQKNLKLITIFSILALIISSSYTLSKVGKIRRDKNLISDIYKIGTIIPEKTTISICPVNYEDWVLHAYLMRYFRISLDNKNQQSYYLINKNSNDSLLCKYTKLNLDTKIYDLYKIK